MQSPTIHNAVRTFTLDTHHLCCENNTSPPVADFACYVCIHALPWWSFFISAVFLNSSGPGISFITCSKNNLFSLSWKIAMCGLLLFSQQTLQFWKKSTFSKLFSIYNCAFKVLAIKCYWFRPTPISFITCWNPFHTKCLKAVSAAPNTTCGYSKQRPLCCLLPGGQRKKITGTRFGGITSTPMRGEIPNMLHRVRAHIMVMQLPFKYAVTYI